MCQKTCEHPGPEGLGSRFQVQCVGLSFDDNARRQELLGSEQTIGASRQEAHMGKSNLAAPDLFVVVSRLQLAVQVCKSQPGCILHSDQPVNETQL